MRVIAPGAAASDEPEESYQADSTGRFWMVREPSAKVSSKSVVARAGSRAAQRSAPTKIDLNRRVMGFSESKGVAILRDNVILPDFKALSSMGICKRI